MDRRIFLGALGASTLAGCAGIAAPRRVAASPQSSLPFAAECDAVLEHIRDRLQTVAGLAVAVVTPDGAFSRGLGFADVAAGVSADAATAFYIASATKPMTALALSAQQGRRGFGLDVPLTGFAPMARFAAEIGEARVTFRHLLTHTSAIGNDPLSYRLAFTGEHDAQTLWALLANSSFNRAALGQFDYTNTGYNIATMLTDRAWGEAWQDVLARTLFEPAGMRATAARRSTLEQRNIAIARPHAATPDGIQLLPLEKVDATMQSAGGVMMSADDAVRWLELLTNGGRVAGRQIVPEPLVPSLFVPGAQVDSSYEGYRREGYGLGWYLGPLNGEPLAHHFGSFAGARAHLSVMPQRRVGVVVLENETSAVPMVGNIFARFVYARLAGDPAAHQRLEEELTAAVARRDRFFTGFAADRARRAARPWQLRHPHSAYAGVFRNAAMGTVHIAAAGAELNLRFGILSARAEPYDEPDAIRVELVPQSASVLRFSGSPPNAFRLDGAVFERV